MDGKLCPNQLTEIKEEYKTRIYETEDKKRRYVIEVVAHKFKFFSSKKE